MQGAVSGSVHFFPNANRTLSWRKVPVHPSGTDKNFKISHSATSFLRKSCNNLFPKAHLHQKTVIGVSWLIRNIYSTEITGVCQLFEVWNCSSTALDRGEGRPDQLCFLHIRIHHTFSFCLGWNPRAWSL